MFLISVKLFEKYNSSTAKIVKVYFIVKKFLSNNFNLKFLKTLK